MEEEKIVQNVKQITASSILKYRIDGLVATLPAHHNGIYFPLLAFRLAIVVILLAIVVGVGSGIVVAVHPIKKIVQTTIAPHVLPITDTIEKTLQLAPTKAPTVTLTPMRSVTTSTQQGGHVSTQSNNREDQKTQQNKTNNKQDKHLEKDLENHASHGKGRED